MGDQCAGNRRSRKKRKPDSPWGERWIVAKMVAVLVSQKPWDGPDKIRLITWCRDFPKDLVERSVALSRLTLEAHMKRRKRDEKCNPNRTAVDDRFESQWPTLYDYLTSTCYDDDPKQPRDTSTLLIFGADGCFKACLRDRAEHCCCWCAAASLIDLLGVLDAELANGTAVWREDRLSGAPEAKRLPRQKKVDTGKEPG